MRYLMVAMFLMIGCTKDSKPEIVYPDRLPISEQAKELTALPSYSNPESKGLAAPLSKDEVAPFDGVILDEEKAMAVMDLRAAYDEVYSLASSDRKYLLSVIEIQERELHRGDQVIRQREEQLWEIQNSWWERNKITASVMLGLVLGVGLAVATGKVWALVDEKE